MTVPFSVKGWCPGALRPMETGDGLIVRLRLFAGRLSPDLATAIAGLAEAHGNGRLDLSQRANLQLRGVRAETLPALMASLRALGLLDDDAAAEAVRNVMVAPMAGPEAVSIARALEAALTGEPDLTALPGKFGFLVDDGAPSLAGVRTDINLRRAASGSVRIALAGADGAVVVRGETAGEVALALARAFLSLRAGDRRMADLVARLGAGAVAARAGLAFTAGAVPELEAGGAIGVHDDHVLAGVPFGQLGAAMLRQAAEMASGASAGVGGEIRLTPFRALLFPAKGRAEAERLGRLLEGAGFVLDPADPRLAVVACPGAPDCLHGEVPARADALALAEVAAALPGAGVRLHVSGCAKGCAHPGKAAVTLFGRDGRYDLVRNGRAGDAATETGLTLEAARAALARLGSGPRSGAK